MPRNVNGIGTTYYGASNRQPDGSFVTTEWFIMLYLPLIPLHSWHVRYQGETSQWTKTTNLYNILAEVPLDRQHILKVYAWMFIPFALLAPIACLGSFMPTGTVATILSFGLFLGIGFWVIIFPWRYKAK